MLIYRIRILQKKFIITLPPAKRGATWTRYSFLPGTTTANMKYVKQCCPRLSASGNEGQDTSKMGNRCAEPTAPAYWLESIQVQHREKEPQRSLEASWAGVVEISHWPSHSNGNANDGNGQNKLEEEQSWKSSTTSSRNQENLRG